MERNRGKSMAVHWGVVLMALSLSAMAAGGEVPLLLQNPSAMRSAAWPMTTGVPFPKDALASADQVSLVDAQGRDVPVQARVAGAWGPPKGSVRWLLLDFQAALDGSPKAAYWLRFGPDARPTPPAKALSVRNQDGKAWEVSTGPLTFTVRRDRFDGIHRATLNGRVVIEPNAESGPYFVDGDGKVFRANQGDAKSVAVEEEGPLRVVLCARGWFYDAEGRASCQYIARLHAYAGQPFVRVFYTFLMTERSDKLRFRDIGLHVAFHGAQRAVFGGDAVPGHDLAKGRSTYLLQYDSDKFVVRTGEAEPRWEAEPPGKQAAGWMQLAAAGPDAAAVTIACRDFWQQFPKELEAIGGSGGRFHVWPAHGVAMPGRKVEDANIQYLWFCHEGRELDFRVPEAVHAHKEQYSEYEYRYVRDSKDDDAIGLAKTHELLLWFHGAADEGAARAVEAWQEDPVIMADPRWMCASGVLGRLHPYDPERFGEVEEALSRGWDAERRLEAYTRDYGMWHWGDGHTAWDMKRKRWADVYRCWRSFHHGAPRTSWVLYLRSGDPKYWRHALRNARHCMDVDVCHWATDEDEKLPWPKGKICGALRDYKGITHWHAGGRLFDYNCLTDFMLYYYYMTGDHRGMEVAQEWGDAAKRLFTSPFGSRSGAGVLSSLIDLYQATWDPALKRLIDAQIEHFFKVQVTDDNQIAPDGVASAVPKFRGKPLPRGAFTEWENYAPWIERHYDLTADRRTGDRIALWADSYLAGWGDSWSGMGVGAYVNVLAYAYFASKDVKYLEHGLYCVQKYANSVERSPGQFYDGFPHQGQMSLGPGYMEQRIPHLLAALAEHGKPVEAQSLATGPFSLLFTRRWPEGKKVEYVDAIIREEHDAAFSVVALGGTTYKDKPIRMVFKSPSGKELVNKAHAVQPGAFELKADAPADGETGDYQVQVSGEGSFWNVQSTLRTEPALKIVYPFDGRQVRLNASRYYFLVPKGVTVFRVAATPIGAGAIYAVRDPEGRQVKRVTVPMGEDAAKAVITAEVRPEQAGRLWQIEGLSADVVLRIEAEGGEVPPFFAVDPEAFFVPAPAKAK